MSYAADVAHGTKQQSGWTAADVDRYVLPAPDLSSKPLTLDGRTLDRFMKLSAYYADRVINTPV